MKDILNAVKNILISNWHALAAVVVLSLILALWYDVNFILSILMLFVLYFVIGCLIEYTRQSYIHKRKTTYGKSEEQLKKEAEIRARRKAKGQAMLEKEKIKPAEQVVEETPVKRVRRIRTYTYAPETAEAADEEIAVSFERPERKSVILDMPRKRSPFDIAPPAEIVEEEADHAAENVDNVEEFDSVEETTEDTYELTVTDDVHFDTVALDELYTESDNVFEDDADVEVVTEEEITEQTLPEEVYNTAEENAEKSGLTQTVAEPMSVNKIQQTTESLSKEIRERVNTHRRHSHKIFDPYAVESATAKESENVFGDTEKVEDTSDFDADYDFTPTADTVDADQNKLDELYGEKLNEPKPQPKGNFLSRAISGLKKKEETKTEKIIERVIKEKTPASVTDTPKFEHRPMYVYPNIDIVKPKGMRNGGDSGKNGYVGPAEEEKAQKLVDTLKSFGIGVKITGITKGPAVTRFEFQPDIGVKISRIVSLTDDIALNLAASGVRMEAPIPGKSAIGIEIPNESIDTVYLYNVLSSEAYKNASSKIAFALGVDLNGKVVIGDIAKMPHMLIAGSTGSGKSVCINTIITSILYGASPDEVKFIMIDPKVVELGIYNGIPHLLIPVVTEPKKASAALAWAVKEVDRRYNVFAECNVRDLKSYNKIAEKSRGKLPKEPQIVIIVDELADLMMAASHDVETSIIRLAQKARAAGVHLVIATQRPSVDVITGLIKANIPSRIAFAVASQFDSRTILDTAGAEKLLGRGDMLYMPIGQPKAMRVQGAFVSDEEVEKLVEFIKSSYGTAYYSEEVVKSIETSVAESITVRKSADDAQEDDADAELIQEAAELAFEFNQLSASFLQRKMKIGFNRAGRIIDTLEERGLLSKSEGSKPRQVIMTREEWDNL